MMRIGHFRQGAVYVCSAVLCMLVGFGINTTPAAAHFGMVIPERPVLTDEVRSTAVAISFSHPNAGEGMDMVKPKQAIVAVNGERTDLALGETEVMGHAAWTTTLEAGRPGLYTLYVEPEPYWEPAEDAHIIHYTKTVVPAFGAEEGWEAPLGAPVEIVPMLRPFGNFAGNVFVGKALRDGEPVPHAVVEVEPFNQAGLPIPTQYHETQVVVADENGVFQFACPRPGWWGFAFLTEADYTLPDPDGADKAVELGGVFWIYMHSYE